MCLFPMRRPAVRCEYNIGQQQSWRCRLFITVSGILLRRTASPLLCLCLSPSLRQCSLCPHIINGDVTLPPSLPASSLFPCFPRCDIAAGSLLIRPRALFVRPVLQSWIQPQRHRLGSGRLYDPHCVAHPRPLEQWGGYVTLYCKLQKYIVGH